MTLAMAGVGVSKGLAMGKAYVMRYDGIEISERHLLDSQISHELERYQAALNTVRKRLVALRNKIPVHTPRDIFAFIDVYLLILDDSTLARAPLEYIQAHHCNAEWALHVQRQVLLSAFDVIEDPYLRARQVDVNYVIQNILQALMEGGGDQLTDGEEKYRERIVIAHELAPADIVLLHHQHAAAFVTETGGATSHTAILARSLGVPMLVALRHACSYLRHMEHIIIDAYHGVLLAGVDESMLGAYRPPESAPVAFLEHQGLKSARAITRDGQAIVVHANIDRPEDVPSLKAMATEGVGLYRTEFLFLNRTDVPDEEEQFQAYQRVVEALNGAPVTIRTFDLGGDKPFYREHEAGPGGSNPALGLRAIRLCLKEPGLFRPQLRAILRASAYGPVRLMLPMLTSLRELGQVMEEIGAVKRELRRQGLKFDETIAIGGMIEVPAAALAAESLAQHLDFLSIGTNDLIQYTLAMDRADEEVNYLYNPLHPAVLRLINMTIRAGRKRHISVAMCGEMAGDSRYTRLLLGMGLTEFSMHPSMMPDVKAVIQASELGMARQWARRIMRCEDPFKLEIYLEGLNDGRVS